MGVIDWISRILVIVGGINWGLIGIFGYNLVAALFGEGTSASKIIYSLVGIAAVYELIRILFGERVTERADRKE